MLLPPEVDKELILVARETSDRRLDSAEMDKPDWCAVQSFPIIQSLLRSVMSFWRASV
jgi:hypothetical protein